MNADAKPVLKTTPIQLPSGDPPVDMNRLLYITDGDPDTIREIVDIYIRQTEEQLSEIFRAIENQSAQEVHALTHSCIGSSSTCGMVAVIIPLRELEKMGCEGHLTGAQAKWDAARLAFEEIKFFLTAHTEAVDLPSNIQSL